MQKVRGACKGGIYSTLRNKIIHLFERQSDGVLPFKQMYEINLAARLPRGKALTADETMSTMLTLIVGWTAGCECCKTIFN
jgi:hypothetical protein